MAGNSIFIAKRKNERTHVLLRAYRREALAKVNYDFTPDALDKLLLAQDPESFVYAVSDFHPLSLFPLCEREAKTRPRKQTVRQFRADCKSFYESIDGAVLMEECTGLKDDGTELNKSSLKRAVREFDAVRNGAFLCYLSDNAFTEDDYVVAEPVQDWIAAKAFVSNIIRFQAYLGNDAVDLDFEDMPAHNGCWIYGKSFDRNIRERARQFSYNPGWHGGNAGEAAADLFDPETVSSSNPLLSKYLDQRDEGPTKRLRNSIHIRFKAAQGIFGEPLSLFAKGRKSVTDRSLYLVADLDCPAMEIALDYINALLLTTEGLRSENDAALGWEADYIASALNEADRPGVTFYSQWARLVYYAAFHPQHVKAGVCKNCGRPMLNHTGRKLRQFCRPSCRTAYYNAHMGEAAMTKLAGCESSCTA